MTEIDFETLVSRVTQEMDRTWSEFLKEDSIILEEALEQYKCNVTGVVRAAFDEAEAIAEIEERFRALQQEMVQLQSRIKDIIK